MKTCSKCRLELDFKYFSKKSSTKDGLQPYCKSCASFSMKKYYVDNKDHHTKLVKSYKEAALNSNKSENTHYTEAIQHLEKCLSNSFCKSCSTQLSKVEVVLLNPTTKWSVKKESIIRECLHTHLPNHEQVLKAISLKLDKLEKFCIKCFNISLDIGPSDRAKRVLTDSKRYDKKHEYENDLDAFFIDFHLKNPCSYCAETDVKSMTLDRIDNNKGHTKDNVVVACYRCNLIRRDMPYEAWLFFKPSLKQARESGFYGDWIGGFRKNNGPKR